MNKKIFEDLEEAGEFINMGYENPRFFLIIRKDKYEKIKQDYLEEDWVGYDEKEFIDKPNKTDKRKGFPYRKGRK